MTLTLQSRQKLILALLSFYWIILFILCHIPIPKVVYQAQVSDKTLHFVAYILLGFLLWFSLNPDTKVNWRKPSAWLVFFVIILYGIFDEVTQGYVGRSCDIMDFLYDVIGVVAGLILFSFLSFWPAFLAVSAIAIFLITNVGRANIAQLAPVMDFTFHFFAYAFFTLLWIRCINLFSSLKPAKIKWLTTSLALPCALLAIVKSYSFITGRPFGIWDIVLALAGIIAASGAVFLTVFLHRRYYSILSRQS
jgi:VanZ family protein